MKKDWLDTTEFFTIAREGMQFTVSIYSKEMGGFPMKIGKLYTYRGFEKCRCNVSGCKGYGLFSSRTGKRIRMCMSWKNIMARGGMHQTYLIPAGFPDILGEELFEI